MGCLLQKAVVLTHHTAGLEADTIVCEYILYVIIADLRYGVWIAVMLKIEKYIPRPCDFG